MEQWPCRSLVDDDVVLPRLKGVAYRRIQARVGLRTRCTALNGASTDAIKFTFRERDDLDSNECWSGTATS